MTLPMYVYIYILYIYVHPDVSPVSCWVVAIQLSTFDHLDPMAHRFFEGAKRSGGSTHAHREAEDEYRVPWVKGQWYVYP